MDRVEDARGLGTTEFPHTIMLWTDEAPRG